LIFLLENEIAIIDRSEKIPVGFVFDLLLLFAVSTNEFEAASKHNREREHFYFSCAFFLSFVSLNLFRSLMMGF